jgi:hypothetical protein
LQWNINRWYDSDVGQWISEDPIGFKGGDKNLYRYVRNSCLTDSDIDGLITSEQAQKIIFYWAQIVPGAELPYAEGYMRKLIYEEKLKVALNNVGTDLMLIGIPLPDGLIGQVAVTAIKSILKDAINEGGNLTNERIIAIIKDTTGQVVDNQHPLVSVIRQWITNASDFSSAECSFEIFDVERKFDDRIEKASCNFWVCGKVITSYLFPPKIKNWKLSGKCHYKCCTKTKRECHQLKEDILDNALVSPLVEKTFDVSGSGNGLGSW